MKKIYYCLGIALAACLSSCSDDSLDNGKSVVNPVHTGDEILFGSSLSDNANMIETRTVYGDRTDTGVPVYWEEDGSDEIAIFCLQSSQPADHLVHYKVMPETEDLNKDGKPDKHQAASVTKVNTAEAGLQWGAPDTEHRFYAFYPASAVKGSTEENETGKITANIPVTQQVQEWRTGTFSSKDGDFNGKTCYFGLPNMDYAYMYAYNAVTPSQVEDGSLIDLHFKNLVTVLDITIQGPESGDGVVVTNVNVDAIDDNENVILTGDFTCDIRAARNEDDGTPEVTATCTPIPSNTVRNRISIPCYAKNQENDVNKGFITLKPGELMNVKAYIIPQDEKNTVTKHTLRVSVATLNGAPCRKTLNTDDVDPHKINRVILPKLVSTGTNYWLSNLDPDIYFSELSIPGSFQSAATSADGSADAYQGMNIEQQFKDGIRLFSFQTTDPGDIGNPLHLYYAGKEQNTTLTTVANQIKELVQNANVTVDNKNQYKNEFAVIEVWYKQTGSNLVESSARSRWIKTISQRVNDWANNNGFVVNPSADMTIGDLANKVVVIIRYDTDTMLEYLASTETYHAVFLDWVDEKTEMQQIPIRFGNPHAADVGLTINVQDVTYINRPDPTFWTGDGGNMTLDEKTSLVESLFKKSVDNYPNKDVSLSNWYFNNLGGFYHTNMLEGGKGGNTRDYATAMNNNAVGILQNRTENVAIGFVLMNFADKQSTSGAKYKSDWLIQTIIDNNFKFELRTRPSEGTTTTTYNAAYNRGGNAIGWDE